MKLISIVAILAALLISVAAETQDVGHNSPTDINNPMYQGLSLPKGDKVVAIKPVGDDTVLEEGAEHEVSAEAAGKPEAVPNEEPTVHTLDKVSLADSDFDKSERIPDIDNPSTKNSLPEDKPKTAADVLGTSLRSRRYCPSKCYRYRKYCPRGCYRARCYLRYRVKYRKRYRVRVRIKIRVRRRVRVRVKYCKRYRYGHYGYYKKRCYYRYHYRYVYGYVYRYRYYYRYRYVYRYKYVKAVTCKSY